MSVDEACPDVGEAPMDARICRPGSSADDKKCRRGRLIDQDQRLSIELRVHLRVIWEISA
jgi:hypothetical protein